MTFRLLDRKVLGNELLGTRKASLRLLEDGRPLYAWIGLETDNANSGSGKEAQSGDGGASHAAFLTSFKASSSSEKVGRIWLGVF